MRFLAYQIGKIFNPYPIVFAITNKAKLIVEQGMKGATGNIYCGLHEFEDMSFLLHFLRKEDLFVDVGANIGSYTVLASGHVECRTIAFEPVPSTFEKLKNNISINLINEKVQPYNIGVGSTRKSVLFTSDSDTTNHVAISGEEKGIRVSLDTLDSCLQEDIPLLIKIDVEGYETEVLNGADVVLKHPALKAIIIELNGSGLKYGFHDEHIHQYLVELGFLLYQYDPFSRIVKKSGSSGTTNALYLRNPEFVMDRLKNADTFEIFGLSI